MKTKLKRWVCVLCAAILVLLNSTISGQASALDPGFIPQSNALELVNLDTGDTVYAKNPDKRIFQASTTKVMTFIVASELIKDPKNTMITIADDVQKQLPDRSFVTSQLAVGEKISALNLMYCMLVSSGNDAAIALAQGASDNHMAQFVAQMNQKAKQLGCTGTNFTNVFGKYDPNHYTTVHDLKKIYQYAYKLPHFLDITSAVSYTVPKTNYTPPRKLVNSNKLLDKASSYYYAPCKSGKTGTSDQAGYCLISTALKNGTHYLCIAMGAPSTKNGKAIKTNGAFDDSRRLYDWAFDSLRQQRLLSKTKAVANLPVLQASPHDRQLAVVPASDYNPMLPADGGKISKRLTLPKQVTAPIKAGQKVGSVTVLYQNEPLTTLDLVAAETINQYIPFYRQAWFRIAVIALGIAAIVGLLLLLIRALHHRHRRGGFGGGRARRNRYSSRRGRHRRSKSGYHNYH